MRKFLLALPILLLGNQQPLVERLLEAGKPYDLGLTLLAIAKVESNFGQVKVNLQDPSCGITMIHLKFFLHRYKWKDTPLNRNIACQKLIDDPDLAIAETLALLNFWKAKFCTIYGCTSEQYLKVWGAYNAGYSYASKSGTAYALKIKSTIRRLKNEYQSR